MLERAGAQILTCHGRTREQRGQNTVCRSPTVSSAIHILTYLSVSQGLADWAKIRAVKAAVSVPVFANGNILTHADIARCLAETNADAVMSAEGQLYNAALFARGSSDSDGLHPPHADLALEYLHIVASQKTPTPPSGIKGHLFKLMRPALAREVDLRDALGRLRGPDLGPYYDVVREMKRRMDEAAATADGTEDAAFPYWVAQPYVRPLPVTQVEGGSFRSALSASLLMGSLCALRNITYGGKALACGADTGPWGRRGGQACRTRRCGTDANASYGPSGMIANASTIIVPPTRANTFDTFSTSFSTNS